MFARLAIAVLVTGCSYRAEFRDCTVSCGSTSDCPASYSCGNERLCRVAGATQTCADVLGDAGLGDTPITTSTFVPSIIGPQCVPAVDDLDLDVTSDHTIDTGAACTTVVTQTTGVHEICVLRYANVRIAAGATLHVVGVRALALVATNAITIDGALDASAHHLFGGPGEFASGPGAGGDTADTANTAGASGGAGGGGHASSGAPGGDACVNVGGEHGGPGGGVIGVPSLVPLTAGSRGGHQTTSDFGAGGGAIELVGCQKLVLGQTGVIAANGGGGGAGRCIDSASCKLNAGGGGGAGGGILIEAQHLAMATGAAIVANGGGGGAGAGLETSNCNTCFDGSDGMDGTITSTPAPGGSGKFYGGSGGAGSAAPQPGATVPQTCFAGDGGGAVGRIRINLPAGVTLPSGGILISPQPSLGTVVLE